MKTHIHRDQWNRISEALETALELQRAGDLLRHRAARFSAAEASGRTIDIGADRIAEVFPAPTSAVDNAHLASWSYGVAERRYLEAAMRHFTGGPESNDETPAQIIQRLPDPLREELALLEADHRRDAELAPTEQARLDRAAEYMTTLGERVRQAVSPERTPESTSRSR